ncbi:ribose-5-phosphate isomerase RpiA [Actibacterium sp. 188UL27-1]|uniref:ribose-5-phosphate isomerase RpiA n=1 Tax=Actibacterium sp. 188UL27-1 TaxID=2786961 RepID=UPI00195880EC|nr:ribose-5-phosphate isomerase RpiA [Actibacterium sp. 188UL27-1]MBM7068556.1 ribose-5-phosphate isomerase RpiA [Actibacterium sp. 188UL27-1]
MYEDLSPIDTAKRVAATRAVAFVENGMKVGLGTGSTAAWMVKALADKVHDKGLRIVGVATSAQTAKLATEMGLTIVSLNDAKWLDLTIDGADEFDGNLSLIKGGGGALLIEKIVATASDRMIVIADAAKEVNKLGAFPLPVEVIPFGWQTTKTLIEQVLVTLDVLGSEVTLRMSGDTPYVTDEGNHILDLHLRQITNPRQTTTVLNQIPGVVENGLFVDICDAVVIGQGDGTVEMRDISTGKVQSDKMILSDPKNAFSDLGNT